MSTTIHLTDAQRDQFAACGMFAVDGEPVTHLCSHPLVNGQCSVRPTIAPEGWRILTEPCDNCAGKGKLGKYAIFNGPDDLTDCPDCVGGRRVVTFTATCPGPHVVGTEHEAVCPGVVTLGRFTVPALLPVVDGEDVVCSDVLGNLYIVIRNHPCVVVTDVTWLICPDGEIVARQVTLDPPPRPGSFVVRPERVA